MDTGHAIATTILLFCLVLAYIGHRSPTVGPLLHLGLALGLGIGISGTYLILPLITRAY